MGEVTATRSAPQFTPGPWRVEKWDGYSDAVAIGGKRVKGESFVIVGGAPPDAASPPEKRANAYLCAAAPDLYAAAYEAATFLEARADYAKDPAVGARIDLLKRALATARGEV